MTNKWPLLITLILLSGCSRSPLEATCPYADRNETAANAGCLIVHKGKVMTVQQRSGKYNMPGGTSDDGETSSCTAYREVFEETGHQVVVNELLAEFDNGFRLYACDSIHPDQGFDPVNPLEIKSVQWSDPEELSQDIWRFPDRFEQQQSIMMKHLSE